MQFRYSDDEYAYSMKMIPIHEWCRCNEDDYECWCQ